MGSQPPEVADPATSPATKEPKKKPAARAAEAWEITTRAAYRLWEQTFRPRPSDADVCPFVESLGRHYCGCDGCPPACPRHVDHEVVVRPRNPDPPPLGRTEASVIWARVRLGRGAGVVQGGPHLGVTPSAHAGLDSRPPAPPTAKPDRYPPCASCGAVRTVMLVLGPDRAGEFWTICWRCY